MCSIRRVFCYQIPNALFDRMIMTPSETASPVLPATSSER
jgi:hypothetical protein